MIAEKHDRNNTCGWAVRKKKVETCWKGSNVLKTCGLCWNVLTVPCFWFDLKKKLILTQNFQFCLFKNKVDFVWNGFGSTKWLKTDEKVRGCLFIFGLEWLWILQVYLNSGWNKLLVRVRSYFKMSKVVPSSRIR